MAEGSAKTGERNVLQIALGYLPQLAAAVLAIVAGVGLGAIASGAEFNGPVLQIGVLAVLVSAPILARSIASRDAALILALVVLAAVTFWYAEVEGSGQFDIAIRVVAAIPLGAGVLLLVRPRLGVVLAMVAGAVPAALAILTILGQTFTRMLVDSGSNQADPQSWVVFAAAYVVLVYSVRWRRWDGRQR